MGLVERGAVLWLTALSLRGLVKCNRLERKSYGIQDPLANLITYRYTTTTRVTQVKSDPDSFFFGFFPIWSAILFCLTCVCLLLSAVGLCCWLAGCTNPRRRIYEESRRLRQKREIEKVEIVSTVVEQVYDDISVKNVEETVDQTASSVYNDSKLMSESKLISECEYETRAQIRAKKKKFRRDHL